MRSLRFLASFACVLMASSATIGDHHNAEDEERICFGDADFDCGQGELRARCISSFRLCDNVFDCTTGADELMCRYLYQCPPGHFMCHNRDCILANHRCDGALDCLDGSDERGCIHAGRLPFPWTARKPQLVASSAIHSDVSGTKNSSSDHHGWFSVLSLLLALLIIGQLLVLGIVFLRKKRQGRGGGSFLVGNAPVGNLRKTRIVRFVSTKCINDEQPAGGRDENERTNADLTTTSFMIKTQ